MFHESYGWAVWTKNVKSDFFYILNFNRFHSKKKTTINIKISELNYLKIWPICFYYLNKVIFNKITFKLFVAFIRLNTNYTR